MQLIFQAWGPSFICLFLLSSLDLLIKNHYYFFFFLGSQQQQQQQQQQQAANHLDNLAKAVMMPHIFNDERDVIIAKWNLLQAYWGTGRAYFDSNGFVDLTSENLLCRFKVRSQNMASLFFYSFIFQACSKVFWAPLLSIGNFCTYL